MMGTDPSFGPPRYLEVTCVTDGRAHQIDETVRTAELQARSGRLTSLCGRMVVAGSLVDPPGPPCSLCAAALALGTYRQPRGHGHRSRR